MTTFPKQFWPWYWGQNGVSGLDRLPRPWGRIASSVVFAGIVIALWEVLFPHVREPNRSFFIAIFRNPAWWAMLACIYFYDITLRYFYARVEALTGNRPPSIPFGNAKILADYREFVGQDVFYRSCRILPLLVLLLFFVGAATTVSRIQRDQHLGSAPISNGLTETASQTTDGTSHPPALPKSADGPMPAAYSTAYIVTLHGLDWKLMAFVTMLLLIGWIVVRFSTAPRTKAMAWVVFVVGIFFGSLVLLVTLEGYLGNSWDYMRGHYQTVEGVVEKFHPMPYRGRDYESFTVNGVDFSYSDFVGTSSCFNHTASQGGPIRGGLRVRITYIDDDCIVRLDVAPTGISHP